MKRKAEIGDNGSAPKSPRTLSQNLPGRSCDIEYTKPSSALRNNIKGTSISKPTNGSGSQASKPDLATTSSTAATGAAKKGTYREILARAQAAKAAQTDFGQIKHRPGQKLSRRARRLAQEQEATQGSQKHLASGARQRAIHEAQLSRADAQPQKPKPKRPPLEYKGTMRSNTAAEQPQNHSRKVADASRDKLDDRSTGRYAAFDEEVACKKYRYGGSSEEGPDDEESEVVEDDEDLEGGGFDELEAEEELSLRAARKEDAEALRQENEHRRMKMERKRKLEQLAAKAQKPRY